MAEEEEEEGPPTNRLALYKLYHGPAARRRYLSEDLISRVMHSVERSTSAGAPATDLDPSLLTLKNLGQLVSASHLGDILEHSSYVVSFGFGRGFADCQVLVEVILAKDPRIQATVQQLVEFLKHVFCETSNRAPLSRQSEWSTPFGFLIHNFTEKLTYPTDIDEVVSSILTRHVIYPTSMQVIPPYSRPRVAALVIILLDFQKAEFGYLASSQLAGKGRPQEQGLVSLCRPRR